MSNITRVKSASKVTLKDLPFNKELHDKTLQYWKLMRCWNGIDTPPKKLTISHAFDIIRKIQSELNPNRPLNSGLEALKEHLIESGQKAQNKNTVASNIARITIL